MFKKIAHIAILTACFLPISVFATVTYDRTPPDFYAGHSTVINISSDDVATDLGDCTFLYLGNYSGTGQAYLATSSASTDFIVPDNMLVTYAGYQGYTFGLLEDQCTYALIGGGSYINYDYAEEAFEYDDTGGGFYPAVFTTFPSITSGGGSGTSTTIYATSTDLYSVNNPSLDWFLGFLIFFICMVFPIWLFRRK